MFGRIVWRAIRGGIAMLLFGCIDPPVGVRFETLAMGERVDMSYETEGCFEHMTAKLVFTRLPDGLAIESRTPELRIEVKKHLDLRAMRRLDASLHAIRSTGAAIVRRSNVFASGGPTVSATMGNHW